MPAPHATLHPPALQIAKSLGSALLNCPPSHTHHNPLLPGALPRLSAMTTLGEEEFNKIETAVLDQVQAYYGTVVSTGSIAPVDYYVCGSNNLTYTSAQEAINLNLVCHCLPLKRSSFEHRRHCFLLTLG
jgi:hypothetical protein